MADEEPVKVDAQEENQENKVENGTDEPQLQELSGWLMKRTKITHKWLKTFVQLKKNELSYGKTAELLHKHLSMDGVEISQCSVDNKQHCFSLKPQSSKRVYYFHADSEADCEHWMQAVCYARAAGRSGGQSEACVIQ